MSTVVDNAADVFEFGEVREAVPREKIVNEFARVTQYLTWPVLYLLFNCFFIIKVSGALTFKRAKSPFVIIANHIAFYDSFLFRLVFGPITPYLPLRFMAVTKFESRTMNFLAKIGIVDFVYSLFGVFTVTPGLGIDKNIHKAKEIIRIGGNIVIYPEGRVTHGSAIGPFKKGAAVLQHETRVQIIPVTFRRAPRKWLRSRIQINVGEPLEVDEYRSIDEVTNIFYKVISRLYAKVS